MNEELVIAVKIALANTFMMYFKSHSYHWNVRGSLFSQYHEFFGDLYEELHAATDVLAEEIRMLDSFAPHSLINIIAYSTIVSDSEPAPTFQSMLGRLLAANNQTIMSLEKAVQLASQDNNQSLADIISGRLSVHKKHQWMLKSSMDVV